MREWLIITGEYAPQQGGVADFAALQAEALAAAGDAVDVHVPAPELAPGASPVRVHLLPDRFGPRAALALHRAQVADTRVMLLHHSPFGLGARGLNVAFPIALRAIPGPLVVLFHEVHFPLVPGQPMRHRVLARAQQAMARALLSRASAVCVSTEAWTPLMRELGWRGEVVHLPIPSNLLPPGSAPGKSEARARLGLPGGDEAVIVGHFGTYGEAVAGPLAELLPGVLSAHDSRYALLLGRGATRFRERLTAAHPEIASRLIAPGHESPGDVSLGLLASDVLLQPFLDGATTRRTSLMAGLAHGRPVCTNSGPLSEPLWNSLAGIQLARDPGPAALREALEALILRRGEWDALGGAAAESYAARFSLGHGVAALRRVAERVARA